MPRKNRRDQPQPLVDLTPVAFIPAPHTSRQEVKPRAVRERENAERQQAARMKNGIDWSVCLVPGCGRQLVTYSEGNVAPDDRDPSVFLPMCHGHAAVVHRNVQRMWGEDELLVPAVIAAQEAHKARSDRIDRQTVEYEQGGPGAIYFLRQNGLVKVGWTSNLEKRLKAYGPDVDILCHYPGTRQDETTLHRQLRDHLAKGREWYHDDEAIALFVNDAVKRYGPPKVRAYWTQPKSPEIKQRRR